MKRVKAAVSRPSGKSQNSIKPVDFRQLNLQKESAENAAPEKILIITLANSVHEEDSLGSRVAAGLRSLKDLPKNVEVLDEHTDLLGIGFSFRDSRRVLVVDSFLGHHKNGRVHVIPREELSSYRGCSLSARQLSAVESLELLLTIDPGLIRVEIYLILIEICTIKSAPELPTRFEGSVQQVIDTIRAMIAEPFREMPAAPESRRGRASAAAALAAHANRPAS